MRAAEHQVTSYGIVCGALTWPFPGDLRPGEEGTTCPICRARVVVKVFPAFTKSAAGGVPQPLGADTEASCFYHSQNRATAPCDECGRFLCNLCMLEIPGARLCPVCFEANVRGRKLQHLETSRTMHDSVALALAAVPVVILWPITIITAPLTLFWIFRHWNSPSSVVPRLRWRFYLAGLLAVTEIGLIVALVIAILKVRR